MERNNTRLARIPDDDATEWERAMIMADDLSETGVVGEQQAKVYTAMGVFDIPAETVQEKLQMTESNSFTTFYDARDNVENAEELVALLDDHPALLSNQNIEDIPADEFNAMTDSFAEGHHDLDESDVGEQFVTEHGHVGTLFELLDPPESNSIGYLLTIFDPSSGDVDRRAVAASRISDMIDGGDIKPCSLTVETDE